MSVVSVGSSRLGIAEVSISHIEKKQFAQPPHLSPFTLDVFVDSLPTPAVMLRYHSFLSMQLCYDLLNLCRGERFPLFRLLLRHIKRDLY